ncbi:MAG: hypothetical protein ACK551_06255 [Vampirovibrionales bacterium]
MQATTRERLQPPPTSWRSTHVEIPLRVVAHQLNVPTYLVLRLASRLGFFSGDLSQGQGNYLSKAIQKEGVFFSPQQCAAMQNAISQLKAGQSWQDLSTFEERTPPVSQVKVVPLYVKALQGKAWLPQYQRPPLKDNPKPEKKATPKKEATAASGKRNPFGKARPFQRLNHTQAIWTNPPEGKHPFLP